MSRRPQVEELGSSEDEYDSDPPLDDPSEQIVLKPATASRGPEAARKPHNPSLISPTAIPTGPRVSEDDYKNYVALYPVYFDATRNRSSGRRVSKELAVANPLAHGLAQACSALGLNTVYEPMKTHPKDWANPGRVKVDLKNANSARIHSSPALQSNPKGRISRVNAEGALCKRHLYTLVGRYLTEHTTTEEDPLKAPAIRGLEIPNDSSATRPHRPKGWKMGEILPLHSPGLSGGPISDDMFKDMLGQMGQSGGMGQLGNAMAALAGSNSPAAGSSKTEAGRNQTKRKTRS